MANAHRRRVERVSGELCGESILFFENVGWALWGAFFVVFFFLFISLYFAFRVTTDFTVVLIMK